MEKYFVVRKGAMDGFKSIILLSTICFISQLGKVRVPGVSGAHQIFQAIIKVAS